MSFFNVSITEQTQLNVSDIFTTNIYTSMNSNNITENDYNDNNNESNNAFINFILSNLWWLILICAILLIIIIIIIIWRYRENKSDKKEAERSKSDKIRKELSTKIDTHYSSQSVRGRNQSGISKHYHVRDPSNDTNMMSMQSNNSAFNLDMTAVISMSSLSDTLANNDNNNNNNNNNNNINQEEDSINMMKGNFRKVTESQTVGSKLDHGDDDYYLVTMLEQNYAQSALKEDLQVISPSSRARGATDDEFAKVLGTLTTDIES